MPPLTLWITLYFLLTPKENKYHFPVEILVDLKNNGGMNRKQTNSTKWMLILPLSELCPEIK